MRKYCGFLILLVLAGCGHDSPKSSSDLKYPDGSQLSKYERLSAREILKPYSYELFTPGKDYEKTTASQFFSTKELEPIHFRKESIEGNEYLGHVTVVFYTDWFDMIVTVWDGNKAVAGKVWQGVANGSNDGSGVASISLRTSVKVQRKDNVGNFLGDFEINVKNAKQLKLRFNNFDSIYAVGINDIWINDKESVSLVGCSSTEKPVELKYVDRKISRGVNAYALDGLDLNLQWYDKAKTGQSYWPFNF